MKTLGIIVVLGALITLAGCAVVPYPAAGVVVAPGHGGHHHQHQHHRHRHHRH